MHLTLHSKNTIPGDIKPFYGTEKKYLVLSTHCDLRKFNPKSTTFSDLLQYIYQDLEYKSPSEIRGQTFRFQVFCIYYWAKTGTKGYYHKIEIPSTVSTDEHPPLIKVNGTYRVHFYTTHMCIL